MFWKNILRMSIGLIVPIIVGILIICFINITSIWILLGLILIYTMIYCVSMWFLGLNDYEKELIVNPLKKIFKRKV